MRVVRSEILRARKGATLELGITDDFGVLEALSGELSFQIVCSFVRALEEAARREASQLSDWGLAFRRAEWECWYIPEYGSGSGAYVHFGVREDCPQTTIDTALHWLTMQWQAFLSTNDGSFLSRPLNCG